MKNYILLLSLLFAFQLNANTDPNDFESLKQLEGKWIGTLERTDDTTDSFILEFSISSNGSAILEESNTGGIEMLTIFNYQNDELLLTHYCGLMNKPVSKLTSNIDGKFIFKTDDNKYSMREILVNLNIAKNFLNEEIFNLISKLRSSSNMKL